MEKHEKKQLERCLIENDDYFFRDSEMYRPEVDNPKHQVDPTFENKKRETTLKK